MTMEFRLLNTGAGSAAMNMAIDEAVLEHVALGAVKPTLRFYGWSPAAVTIGYFQSLLEEVDLEACKKHDIQYVRRITGGGAVLHEHEITYSIHIPEKNPILPNGILESYRKISEGIIRGLGILHLDAQFVPLNDIVLKDPTANGMLKKISGNAQTRKKEVILQHGTILLKVDVEKMFEILKVPNEKMKGKLIEDVKQRVTSISWVLGREVMFEEAAKIFTQGFMDAFGQTSFTPSELTHEELDRARALYRKVQFGPLEYETIMW